MTVGLFSGPAQMLAIYSAVVGLTYMESDGFRQQASIMGTIPFLLLCFFTLIITMPKKRRYLTACSFFIEGLYFQNLIFFTFFF